MHATDDGSGQTVIVTWEVAPKVCQELVDRISLAYEEVVRHQPGFISSEIHVNDARTRIANYSRWDTREHFHEMLRTEPVMAHNKAINEIATAFRPVLYDVVKTF